MGPFPDTHVPEPPRRPPIWMAAAVVGLVVVLLLAYSLLTGPTSPPLPESRVPTFDLPAFDGSIMGLAGPPGRVVVINFFASWCAPCREEAADLEQTWRQYQDRGVQFFGIAYKDADSRAQAFLDEFDVTYPSTVDRSNRAARDYGLTGVPETFVVDQQGLLVRHFLGPISQAQLAEEIERLLSP